MTAPTKRKQTGPTITGVEVFILAVLLLVGAGGGFLAQQNLEALRAEARLRPLDDISAGSPDGSRGGSLSVADAGASAVEPDVSVPEAPAARPAGIAAGPVRMQSLATIGDLISKRILLPGAQAPIVAAAAARGGTQLPAYAIAPDGKIAPGFGQLFGISDADVANLQATASTIGEQARALIEANTTIEPTGPDTYSIVVSPAPEALALRNQFESALRGVLGDDGFRAFSLLNGEREIPAGRVGGPAAMQLTGVAAMFGGFGNDTKTITITKMPGTGAPGLAGGPRYQYTIKSGTTNGGGSGAGPMLQNLEARVGFPVTKLLPPGF